MPVIKARILNEEVGDIKVKVYVDDKILKYSALGFSEFYFSINHLLFSAYYIDNPKLKTHIIELQKQDE